MQTCTPCGEGQVQTATPIATLPDCILYQAFSKTNVPPTDCQRPSTDCTDGLFRARDIWPKVALSFPASWGRQAGGQGCPVILGWLGCDHPKRKKGPPARWHVFTIWHLMSRQMQSPRQVRARQGGGNTRHTGATTDAHTSTRRGPCPGACCPLQVWLHLELVVCLRLLQA